MYCLLCHEKIPRLRAWRTKSEFCCDEHASLYKKQTLERLLVDPAATQNGQSSLPEPPEPDEFEADEIAPEPVAESLAMGTESSESPSWRDLDFPGELEADADLPEPASEDETEGIGEVWRLADEVHERRGESALASRAPAEVSAQSAEEALEALRNLASRAAKISKEPEDSEPQSVFAMPAPADDVAEHELDEQALLEEIRDFEEEADGTQAAEAEPLIPQPPPAPSPRPFERAEEPEETSILDELMGNPLDSWSRDARAGRPSARAGRPQAEEEPQEVALPPVAETNAVGEAAEALQEIVGALETEAEPVEAESLLDIEAPEPDWDFDGSGAEIAALKKFLAASGSPAATVDPGPPAHAQAELDVSPDEPDWDELAALDLDAAEAEPPEPDLGDEDLVSAAEPPEAVDAKVEAALPDPASPGAMRRTTRFKAVNVFAEIPIELAECRAAAVDGDSPADGVALDIAQPALSDINLPSGLMREAGQSRTMSMHDASVEVEPAAALESGSPADLGPQLGPGAAPFEPAGLFFDLAGGEAETRQSNPEEESVSAGGGKKRS